MTSTLRSLVSPPAPVRENVAYATCCAACDGAYAGSTHREVWDAVRSDPYTCLPVTRVTLASFFRGMTNLLLQAGRRTLRDERDLLPRFDKLIRPNGVCMSGTWEIDASSPYAGLFTANTRALVITRVSVGLSDTTAEHHRAFGMAGKIFATLDGEQRVRTANFFVIDDNGGTRTPHVLDATMTNEPTFSLNKSSLAAAPVLAAIALAQRLADAHTGIRQLYPLWRDAARADAGRPQYLMIRGAPGPRRKAMDFRDELRLSVRDAPVLLELHVKCRKRDPFTRVGVMRLSECVASDSCDHRLHFSHPRWRSAERSGEQL